MRKFHYELEPLLKFKQQRRKQVEIELYQARVKLDAARARQAEAEAELAAARRLEHALGGVTIDRLLAHTRRCAWCEQYLEQLRRETGRIESEYETTARRYRQAAKEVEALLSLRRDQWRLHQLGQSKADQQRLDEFVLRQWDHQRQTGQVDHG